MINFEEEIAKRDAKIAELESHIRTDNTETLANALARIKELEAIVPIESELRAKAERAAAELERELAALKVQQPSAGVVVMPEPMKASEGGEYGQAMVRGFNACLREVARLNPCRAQAVPSGAVSIEQIERHATTAWECPPQSRVVLVSSLKRLADKNAIAPQPAARQEEKDHAN